MYEGATPQEVMFYLVLITFCIGTIATVITNYMIKEYEDDKQHQRVKELQRNARRNGKQEINRRLQDIRKEA